MPSDPAIYAHRFTGHLSEILKTHRKAERLAFNKTLVRRDLDLLYAGLLLDAVTSFERFLEDLFVGLLTTRLVHPSSQVNCRVTFRSNTVCREVINGGRSYVDWLPYDHTRKRAKSFFTGGRPFCDLPKPIQGKLDRIVYIRNAIAHRSNHSLRQFDTKVTQGLTLLTHEQTPTGFLRTVYATHPQQTRFDEVLIDLSSVARKLTT